MEEYEVIKPDNNYNHFERVFITARKLKEQRELDKWRDRQIAKNMEWHKKLAIQKKAQGNPFADNHINHTIVYNKI